MCAANRHSKRQIGRSVLSAAFGLAGGLKPLECVGQQLYELDRRLQLEGECGLPIGKEPESRGDWRKPGRLDDNRVVAIAKLECSVPHALPARS
jgi:hypothetical protein